MLISVRAPVGPTNICPEQSCIGRGLAAIRSLIGTSHFYLLYFLRAVEKDIASQGVGSTFTAIGKNNLNALLISIPPLAEQKRIVEKIDALMALCDELEEKIKQAQDKSEKLMAATIHRLLAG